MKWNLRWAAAKRGIWRPSELLVAFTEVGFSPSLSKVAALWNNTPTTVRLDDLDRICAVLHCTVADLLEAEPLANIEGDQRPRRNAQARRPVRWPTGPALPPGRDSGQPDGHPAEPRR